ncbi:YycH family regulatory protein [Aquibacillus salsiterrae]|uniref:Two-component system activity regulator YycH n=1 Tax=Aquibacillus salsiterrae TaxID=2950439 RepID=A0A9X3WHF5_9BACI|nr:two-component system activity regulator YycH [Aquibacillus salsiterrae]MDC3418491.1 two-component system activity regulator YycH [Aquibacillus salsiterrae]
MKFETIKSIILVVLIMLSLLLTLGIWRYQPDYEYADSSRRVIEADLGGEEQTKRSVILPSQIIYHQDNNHYGLVNKKKENELYQMLQGWSLYDFSVSSYENGEEKFSPNYDNSIEFVFPTKIPTSMISDLFTMDEERGIPESTFDRISISLDEEQMNNQIIFQNTETGFSIDANIQNIAKVRKNLINYKKQNELQQYLVYENNNLIPIYIPEQVNLYKHLFSYKNILVTPLRNVLFNTPSAVRSSGYTNGSQLYSDGSKAMIVYEHHIEYTNPTPAEANPMEPRQLISQTLEFINDHGGWTTGTTDRYQLYDLNQESNKVQFYLTYGGYPIFENSELSMISVTMRNLAVYQYIRPLIQLKDTFGDGQLQDIESGSEIIALLKTDRRFESAMILDVSPGYKMEEQQGGQIFALTPTWFIKDYNGWKELDTTNELPFSRGGGN